MACLFAARIFRAGYPVLLWDTWSDGITAIRDHGVRLEEDGRFTSYPIEVLESNRTDQDFSEGLIFTKSYQTSDSVNSAKGLFSDKGTLLTLQNGLTARDIISNILGPERVLGGITTCAAQSPGPGVVKFQGGNMIRLGGHPDVELYATIFQNAGFDALVETDLQKLTWEKAILNAAINPIGAATGLTNGALRENPNLFEEMLEMILEGCKVGNALGLNINPQEMSARLVQVLEETASNRCSMLQDIENGRPTEIEDINGAILEYAKKLQISVPKMTTITAIIRARKSRGK